MANPLTVNYKSILSVHHELMIKGVPYEWGAKPKIGCPVTDVHTSDCSGYIRWLLYYASTGKIELPEGSADQHSFFEDRVPLTHYHVNDTAQTLLTINFIEPTDVHAGHVWLCAERTTFECYGGHGVGSRPWAAKILLTEVDATFVLPHIWK